MLSAVAPRVMLRHSRFVARQTIRRHASTTEAASSAASKSKDAASNATSKASEGLSKVTSSAGPALRGAAQGVSTAVGRIGGRIGGPAGRVIGLVECEYTDPCALPHPLTANWVHENFDVVAASHYSQKAIISKD